MAAQPNLADQMAVFNGEQQLETNESNTFYDASQTFMNQTCPAVMTSSNVDNNVFPQTVFQPTHPHQQQQQVQNVQNQQQQQHHQQQQQQPNIGFQPIIQNEQNNIQNAQYQRAPHVIYNIRENDIPASIKKSYKTSLCDGFRRYGMCAFGNNCRFAHSPDELRPLTTLKSKIGRIKDSTNTFDPSRFGSPRRSMRRNKQYSNIICNNFQHGECRFGQNCRFYHQYRNDQENSRIPPNSIVNQQAPVVIPAPSIQQQQQQQIPPRDLNQTLPAAHYIPINYNPNYMTAAGPIQQGMPVFYQGYPTNTAYAANPPTFYQPN